MWSMQEIIIIIVNNNVFRYYFYALIYMRRRGEMPTRQTVALAALSRGEMMDVQRLGL